MRIFKKMKILCFIGILCLLNGLMSFLIEPAYGSSDVMWNTFFHEEEIDTIFIGSSLCSASFDPKIFDSRLGVNSYNMGTPMQSIAQNITAVETALEEHDIKTIIIGIGFFVLQEEPMRDAALTFEKELARNKGGIDGFLESMEFVFSESAREDEQSVNYWFPWVYNKESYAWSDIKKNVTSKIKIWSEKLQGLEDEGALSEKKGYVPFYSYINYDEIGKKNSYVTYNQTLREEQLEEFGRLLELCRGKGVDVFVVNTPHPDFDVKVCQAVYKENTETLKQICDKYEVEYYDFSLVKPEVFQKEAYYFGDYEHLNYEGSQVFSEALCEFMIKREAGENMEVYFYTVDEFMAL